MKNKLILRLYSNLTRPLKPMATNCPHWRAGKCIAPGYNVGNACVHLGLDYSDCAVYKASAVRGAGGSILDQLKGAGMIHEGTRISGGRSHLTERQIRKLTRPATERKHPRSTHPSTVLNALKFLLVLCVITAGLAGILAFFARHEHKQVLEASDGRLQAAERSMDRGQLVEAESLIFQVQEDLKQLDKWYAFRSITREAARLKSRCANEQAKLEEVTSRICGALTQWLDLARQSEGNVLDDKIEEAVSLGSIQNSNLVHHAKSMVRFLRRENYDKARASYGQILSSLPHCEAAAEFQQRIDKVLFNHMEASNRRYASIVEAVKDAAFAATLAPGYSDWEPVLVGRAMVWDFTENQIDPAYKLLDDDLRGSSKDDQLTLFCIRKRENIKVGNYMISGAPAYKEKLEISVVYWPEKVCRGATVVWGFEPRQTRRVSSAPEYGRAVKVRDWITGLQRSTTIPAANVDRTTTFNRSPFTGSAGESLNEVMRRYGLSSSSLPNIPSPYGRPSPVTSKPKTQMVYGAKIAKTSAGYVVESVNENSTAAIAGLAPGDRILEINGRRTQSAPQDDLHKLLGPQTSRLAQITITRDGKRQNLSLRMR